MSAWGQVLAALDPERASNDEKWEEVNAYVPKSRAVFKMLPDHTHLLACNQSVGDAVPRVHRASAQANRVQLVVQGTACGTCNYDML